MCHVNPCAILPHLTYSFICNIAPYAILQSDPLCISKKDSTIMQQSKPKIFIIFVYGENVLRPKFCMLIDLKRGSAHAHGAQLPSGIEIRVTQPRIYFHDSRGNFTNDFRLVEKQLSIFVNFFAYLLITPNVKKSYFLI